MAEINKAPLRRYFVFRLEMSVFEGPTSWWREPPGLGTAPIDADTADRCWKEGRSQDYPLARTRLAPLRSPQCAMKHGAQVANNGVVTNARRFQTGLTTPRSPASSTS